MSSNIADVIRSYNWREDKLVTVVHLGVVGIGSCVLGCSDIDHLSSLLALGIDTESISSSDWVLVSSFDKSLSSISKVDFCSAQGAEERVVSRLLLVAPLFHTFVMSAMSLVAGRFVPFFSDLRGTHADRASLQSHGLGKTHLHCLGEVLSETANDTASGSRRIFRRSSSHSVASDVSEVVVRLPLSPGTVLEKGVLCLGLVSFNEVVTDNKLVVGEVFIEVFSFITAASENSVDSKDGDSGNHEDRVHERANQAVDVEVSLEDDSSGHKFIRLLGVPSLEFEEEESVYSTIDDPLNESRPFEASVAAGFVLTHGDPFQAADVRL